jgi:hypothetical protein
MRVMKHALDHLLVVGENELVRRVVKQVVLRALRLQFILQVVHSSIEASKLVDALLVLEADLDVVVVARLHSAGGRETIRERLRIFWPRCSAGGEERERQRARPTYHDLA